MGKATNKSDVDKDGEPDGLQSLDSYLGIVLTVAVGRRSTERGDCILLVTSILVLAVVYLDCIFFLLYIVCVGNSPQSTRVHLGCLFPIKNPDFL